MRGMDNYKILLHVRPALTVVFRNANKYYNQVLPEGYYIFLLQKPINKNNTSRRNYKQYNSHNTFPCKLVLYAFIVNQTGNTYEEGLLVFRPRKQKDLGKPILLLLLLLLLTANGFITDGSVLQCKTRHYNSTQYNKIQYSTVQYIVITYIARNNIKRSRQHSICKITKNQEITKNVFVICVCVCVCVCFTLSDGCIS